MPIRGPSTSIASELLGETVRKSAFRNPPACEPLVLQVTKEAHTAYAEPNTGITRDKYGNALRDSTGTNPASHSNYWTWAIGLGVAAAAAFALITAMGDSTSVTERQADQPSATQPLTPKNAPMPQP